MDDQKFQRDLASYQQEQDFLKHLTTLSTGSILLMVTFLEKLIQNPEWKILIWVSFISFALSIISCLVIHFMSVMDIVKDPEKPISAFVAIIGVIVTIVAFSGFLAGLISLIIFALKNLH